MPFINFTFSLLPVQFMWTRAMMSQQQLCVKTPNVCMCRIRFRGKNNPAVNQSQAVGSALILGFQSNPYRLWAEWCTDYFEQSHQWCSWRCQYTNYHQQPVTHTWLNHPTKQEQSLYFLAFILETPPVYTCRGEFHSCKAQHTEYKRGWIQCIWIVINIIRLNGEERW